MQAALWTASSQRYAIDTRHIVEVVPMVDLRPMAQAMAWVRGMMNYRGELIPLLDAAVLLGGEPCEPRMSSRIVVLSTEPGAESAVCLVGVLVEQFLGVEHLELVDASSHPGLEIPDADYLGPIALYEGETIQIVDPAKILKPEHKTVLFQRTGNAAP